MKNYRLKQLMAAMLCLCVISMSVPVHALYAGNDMLWICFDDVATNMLPDSLSVAGSRNNRVIEDGHKNKALSLSVGYVDNTVFIPIPNMSKTESYIIEFQAGFSNIATSGTISLTTASGGETKLLEMKENGSLFNVNGRRCGAIGVGNRNTISFMFDNVMKTYSVFINHNCVLSRWDWSSDNFTNLNIKTYASSKVKSSLLIDNIRVYEGRGICNKNKIIVYNPEIANFEEVSESDIPPKVYLNAKMDDSSGLKGITKNPKTNIIEQRFEGGNGFYALEKLDNVDSLFVDIPINDAKKQLVFEYDIRHDGSDSDAMLFYIRDSSTSTQVNLNNVSLKSGVVSAGGKSIALSKNKWHTLSFILNSAKSTLGVYVNGKALATNITINSNFKVASLLRIMTNATAGAGKLYIDNLKIYEGSEMKDIDNIEIPTISIYNDEEAKRVLSGKTALSPYVNIIYYNHQKTTTDVPCIIEGDEALISVDTFEKLFGEKPQVSDNNVTIGGAKFIVGEKTMTVSGMAIEIESAPQIEDGQMMIPARAYGVNVLKGRFYDDDYGMFLVSKQEIDIADTGYRSALREANRYLFFNRYSPETLLKKLSNNLDGDLTKHPRIMGTKEDFDRIRETVNMDKYMKMWYTCLMSSAENYMSSSIPEYDVSSGRLFTQADYMCGAAQNLGMAYQLTGNDKYAKRCVEIMLKMCEYPDWYPDHHLGTGEMQRGIAIGFDWCYDAMSVEEKQKIYDASKEIGLEVTSQIYYGTASYGNNWWGKTDTNWSGVINSGTIALCLATAEMNPQYNMKIMEQSMRSMEYPISCIPPVGAWHEGPSYWEYFFRTLSTGLAAYETAMGEVHESVYIKGMDGMCNFKNYFTDPAGEVGMYNDGGKSYVDCLARLYIGKVRGWDNTIKSYTSFIDLGTTKPSNYPALSMLFYDETVTNNEHVSEYPLDGYFRGTEFMSMRQSNDNKNALWVMADGSDSNSSHSHLDTGSFLFTVGGVRWAKDLGTEEGYYSRDGKNHAVNAGYTNLHYYRRKAEGHNMVVINPDKELEIDPKVYTKMQPPVSGIGRAYAKIDLTEAYTSHKVKKYFRGYLLSEGRRAFTVRDEIDLAQPNSEVWWFMHTEGNINILNNTSLLITHEGKQLKMQVVVEGDNLSYELTKMPVKRLVDLGFSEQENSGEKVAIKINGSGKVNITVKMAMSNDPQSETPVELTPIAQWTVEGDDTIADASTHESSAKLSGIKVNGSEVIGFNPNVYLPEYFLAVGEPQPNVEAISDYRTEIQSYPQNNGSIIYEIRVYDENNFFTTYMFTVNYTNALSFDGYISHQVRGALVSSEQTTETTSQNNLRTGSYDGNMETRWSALGSGEWIIHDLGEEKEISAVAIAFNQGNSRTYTFDIQVSNDGENFTDVIMNKTSSGTTNDAEIYDFGNTLKARYVKFTGYGNSTNLWNNVVELVSLERRQ